MFKVGDYVKVKNFNPKTLDWSKSFFSFINQKGKIVKITRKRKDSKGKVP